MILEEARIGEAPFSSPLTDLEIDVFFTLSTYRDLMHSIMLEIFTEIWLPHWGGTKA